MTEKYGEFTEGFARKFKVQLKEVSGATSKETFRMLLSRVESMRQNQITHTF
jgi:hypothetical protein